MAINRCCQCLEKQQEIDRLKGENERLKAKLRQEERRGEEGFFGGNTPSAKRPSKANTPKEVLKKRRGAKPGHVGHGRKALSESDRNIEVAWTAGTACPHCGGALQDKGWEDRTVIESQPLKAERIHYRLGKRYCLQCRKRLRAPIPGIFPRSLYGNQLVSTAAVMHYLHGIPLGRVCEQIGIGAGAAVDIFHRLSTLLSPAIESLTQEYRNAPVKHADETGWRTEGKNGYAWLFATPTLSLFEFRKTRSAEVAHAILGNSPLSGVLVVDRYAGYNKIPCQIQYCYAHLLRDVQSLEKDFPDVAEIKTFVATLAPLLALAMGLRNQKLSDKAFLIRAEKLKKQIIAVIKTPATHLAIRRIQDIFRDQKKRLYHWSSSRTVPAENNLAERDLRPTVIARKTSFGSQSDAGAKTRSVLMTILYTLKKRNHDVAAQLKTTLNRLAEKSNLNPYPLLFPPPPQTHKKSRASPALH